jgi:hypothetical protein
LKRGRHHGRVHAAALITVCQSCSRLLAEAAPDIRHARHVCAGARTLEAFKEHLDAAVKELTTETVA